MTNTLALEYGNKYDESRLKFVGWSNGEQNESYNCWDYFHNGIYQGEDEYGIEPIFETIDGYSFTTDRQLPDIGAYGLYDSETNAPVTYDDLGLSLEEYQAAIRESIECAQVEGHIRVGERRVYAAE